MLNYIVFSIKDYNYSKTIKFYMKAPYKLVFELEITII